MSVTREADSEIGAKKRWKRLCYAYGKEEMPPMVEVGCQLCPAFTTSGASQVLPTDSAVYNIFLPDHLPVYYNDTICFI